MNAQQERTNEIRTASLPRLRQTGKGLAEGLLWALVAFATGHCSLPFGATPFGIALLSGAERHVPYIFLGLAVSALGTAHPMIMLCALSLVLVSRILLRLTADAPKESGLSLAAFAATLFHERLSLRIMTAAVAAFTTGLYALVSGGFLFYDLYGAVIALLVAPLAVWLYSGLYRAKADTVQRTLALSLTVSVALIGCRDWVVLGIALCPFFALLLTLIAGRRYGLVGGLLCGMLCGLSYAPLYSPVFVLAAACFAALSGVSLLLAVSAAFSSGMAYALYVHGLSSVSELLPALLSASLLFVVLDRLFPLAKAEPTLAAIPEASSHSTEERIRGIGQAFASLSAYFRELSREMHQPAHSELREICEDALDNGCTTCGNRSLCRPHREAMIGALSMAVRADKPIGPDDIPPALRVSCERLPDVLSQINHNVARHRTDRLLADKNGMYADDYAAVSALLAEALAQDRQLKAQNEALRDKATDALHRMGLASPEVTVCGGKCKTLIVRSPSSVKKRRHAITATLTEALGLPLVSDKTAQTDTLLLRVTPRLSVHAAKHTVTASKESVYCGDRADLFEASDGDLLAFLSDGMGSGRDAAQTADICATFLSDMLGRRVSTEHALCMLNSFLRNRGGDVCECSATVDLLSVDTVGCRAELYKSGAAPTFLCRGGSVKTLHAKTMPVGILEKPDTERFSIELCEGDLICMVSDGITEGQDTCPWLTALLADTPATESPEQTAERILRTVRDASGQDDATVIVLRIHAA